LENQSNMSSHRSSAAVAARRLRVLSLAALVLAPLVVQAAPAVSTVVAFSGSSPVGNLVKGADGALYGVSTTSTSVTSGLIYRTTVDGSAITTLYQIKHDDGITPQAGLLVGSDGKFYGTTKFGKTGTLDTTGTIFQLAQGGTGYTTLYRFAPFTTVNQSAQPKNDDGAYPEAELIEGLDKMADPVPNGYPVYLYGVTNAGGANGTGTIFRVSRDGTNFKMLHEFGAITSTVASGLTANVDGAAPTGRLLQDAAGYLYGTTSLGGANGRGFIFRIASDGTAFTPLHEFSAGTLNTTTSLLENAEGTVPAAGLIDGGDGFLYGVASQGGTSGYGTIFKIKPDGTGFAVIHTFATANGANPVAELLLGTDGLLYGTTYGGGTSSTNTASTFGTLFSIARDGTAFTVLHNFDGTNGARPAGQLLQLSDTVFVGTASSNGRCSGGTVYRYSTTGETVPGNTSCGVKKTNAYGGGGATGPVILLLLGGLGLARRRRR
jgi:uncharacterized repeat protein (TIGR03803 family)